MDIVVWLGGPVVLGFFIAGLWAMVQTVREKRHDQGQPKNRTKYPPWLGG